MKIALLADIHANIDALDAVLDICDPKGIQEYWFLGDTVGRGPDPVPVLNWLETSIDKEKNNRWLIGNHDAMLADMLVDAGLLSELQWSLVNSIPRETITKHRDIISQDPAAQSFIKDQFKKDRMIPQNIPINHVNYVLTHGSLTILIYRYVYPWLHEILLKEECKEMQKFAIPNHTSNVQVFGHTHVPTLISSTTMDTDFLIEKVMVLPGVTYELDPEKDWLVNPGSVGQPRDLDQRAAYAILDTDENSVTFHRVRYEWRDPARALSKEKYPQRLVSILRDATADKDTPEDWLDHYRKARVVEDE